MKPPKSTRRRGFVLSPVGLKRLQTAILAVEMAENNGDRLTLETLGDPARQTQYSKGICGTCGGKAKYSS